MKKKPEKKKDMEALRDELANAKNVFLTGYEKLTVSQDFELRKTVRGAGGTYKVIKNRIAEKAAEGGEAAALLKELKGDRKSTRLNSSHQIISYAVFCLKKKKKRRRSEVLISCRKDS